ncbi:ring finger membrane protein [Stylonychia lemnae]|uniref:Ring finger membrane protein n=1 Tax=Stylonychia lemnae TaxID=5949 RepID=A0A078B025_STYLE|nr:ring finger membrane protein [Stylonychia lemnae]|eukprot:CDW86378.1 ring finger membrane protein [Stylonychia lemnae]
MEDSFASDQLENNNEAQSNNADQSNYQSLQRQSTQSQNNHVPIRKLSSMNLKECRICFLTNNQEDILNNPCQCKGSMSFVHEQCLVKWITQQNIRICELCKSPFNMLEEYIGFKQLIKNNFQYLISDKRRILKLGIYLLYLYLFGKRLILIFQYFKNFLKYYLKIIFNHTKAKLRQSKIDANQLTRLQKLKLAFYKFLGFLKFIYSLFIAVQLGYLGWNESQRIQGLIKFVINNSKMIRIKSGQAQNINQQQ